VYTASVSSRNRAAVSAPTAATTSSNVMNSSCCPTGAFVVGVKIGSGSFEPSTSPSGSGTPDTVPRLRYSSRPSPAR
jgi:hypothetical protein